MKFPFWYRNRERDLDDEIGNHLEMAIRDRMDRGELRDCADLSANREIGNVSLIKEVTRNMWGWTTVEQLIHDVRFGFRMLLKTPGFTMVAIIALTIGIGANTAIFSVVNSILLRPLPFQDPDRIASIWAVNAGMSMGADRIPSSPAQFVSYHDQTSVFQSIAMFTPAPFNLEGRGAPSRLRGVRATAEFFTVLGVQPALGRVFTLDEDQPGHNLVVVLSYGLWQNTFGGDQNIIGQSVTLNSRNYTIIGVMPPEFNFSRSSNQMIGGQMELWTPMAMTPAQRDDHLTWGYAILARLKPGVTFAESAAQLAAIARRNAETYPTTDTGFGVLQVPLYEQIVGGFRPALLMLLAAVGFVLMIACVNVANLLLARASARHKEIAVRNAIGASRARIIRQLLTESVLLSLIGAGGGLVLAFFGVKSLSAITPANIQAIKTVTIDIRALVFTIVVALATGILFGLVPAWQASKGNLNEALRDSGRGATGKRHLIRDILVVSEMALTLVLLIGAGLMIRSLTRIYQVDLGLDPNNLLTVSVNLPATRYKTDEQKIAFYENVLQRVRVMPGVDSAAATSTVPLSGNENIGDVSIEGQPPVDNIDKLPAVVEDAISPEYLKTMRIPLLKGREFDQHDGHDTPPVAMINESFIRHYIPNEEPIGKRIHFGLISDEGPWYSVVGVVKDVPQAALDTDIKPLVYLPFAQENYQQLGFVVRTSARSLNGDAIRQEIWAVDKDIPISRIATMNQIISDSVSQRRFNFILMSVFAVIALLLASVGIYGVMSYSVTQRTQEVGIRMALGARPLGILKVIIGQGMTLTAIGLIIGLVTAFGLTRLISSLLFGISATDPLTFIGISLLMGLVALIANFIPAARATRIDPILAMRND